MTTKTLLTLGLVTALTSAVAHADEAKKNEKFCEAVASFHSDLKSIDSIGPSSTLAELRAAIDRSDMDAQKVQSAAGKMKTPTATEFTDAAKKLRKDAHALPDNITLDQAKTKLEADIQKVKDAAGKLTTEAGCPEEAPAMEHAPSK
jgi:hypothetical protein